MNLFMTNFKEKLMAATRYALYGKKHPFWLGVYEWEHRDKNKNLIDKWTTINALCDEGEHNILDSYLRDENGPTAFYLMLVSDVWTPSESDSLTDAISAEPSTNGYARQEITRDSTGWPDAGFVLDSGDWMATSIQVIFEATTGSWGPVINAILTNVDSGTDGLLIAYVALSQTRTLAMGETLGCKIKIKLQ